MWPFSGRAARHDSSANACHGAPVTRPCVLITGAARRIGAAIARAFAGAGWHVVVHYRRSGDAARALAGELASAETVRCDLAEPGAPARMVEALAARLEDWRCLVANASVFRRDEALAPDRAVGEQALRVNVLAQAELAAAFLACARTKAGRRVILLTDQKLANPNPDFFSYTMSKHAAASMVPMLAMAAGRPDGHPRGQPGDRVHALAPGAILASHDQSEHEAGRSHRLNLLQRRTSPEEVAQGALFLATGPLASGETLFVDSGQHLLAQKRDVIYLARQEAR